MDEKGFLLGLGARTKIIYVKDFGKKVLLQGKVDFCQNSFRATFDTYVYIDGNREITTIIECVSGSNKAIDPLIIFKGKQHQRSWYTDGPKEGAFFAVSENGWTNTNLALYWIQHVFDRQTKEQAGQGYRLLLIDGHSSHHNYPFLKYCLDNRIIPFCMLPHATHHLQPLDVGIFGPYATYYGQEVDKETRLSFGTLNIGKHNFWSLLRRAREKAFTPTTIASGWRQSGLIPFNPRLVYLQLPGEHTPEPISNPPSSPISVTVPKTPRSIRKLTKKVLQGSTSTPQRRQTNTLLNSVEHLIVSNELLRYDLIEVKKALEAKPKRNFKRLVGPGAFALPDLIKMGELLDQQEQEKNTRKNNSRASKQATRNVNTPIVNEDIEHEEEEIEVEVLDSIEVGI